MISIVNHIISGLGDLAIAALSLLPTSPFQFIGTVDSDILQAMNWAFPIAEAIAHLELYVVAVGAYYAVRAILRWAKVVGD